MINDYSNGKIERFQSGKSLVEQVTAERLNDICKMIESVRLQNGVGYILNRTAQGTTLSIDTTDSRPPKLWKIGIEDVDLDPMSIMASVIEDLSTELTSSVADVSSYTSVFSNTMSSLSSSITTGDGGSASGVSNSISNLFSPIFAVIDSVDSKVDELLSNSDPIKNTIESFFNTKGVRPRSGDMIYTEEFGIVYTIYKQQKDDDENYYPTANKIFRVPFTIGDAADGDLTDENIVVTNYVALTTYPAPDICEICKTILNVICKLISQILGNMTEGLVQSILTNVSDSLYALYSLLFGMIEELLGMINDIDIPGLSDITEDIDALKSEIFGDESIGKTGLVGENGEVDSLSTQLSELESMFEETTFIDETGTLKKAEILMKNIQTITTQIKQEMTWIDSSTGVGYKANALLWNVVTPNVQNIDWRGMEYIGADGNSYNAQLLTSISSADNQVTTGKTAPLELEVCDDESNETVTKKLIEIKNVET